MTDTNDPTTVRSSTMPSGEHEARYLREMERHLGQVAPGRRRELLAIASDNLDERPPASSWGELERALGDPAAYAEELLGQSLPPPRPSAAERRARRRRRQQTAAVIAAVLVTVGAGAAWRHQATRVPDVEIDNSCGGANSSDPRVTFEDRRAVTTMETRIGYVHGSSFMTYLCLSTSRDIEVLGVRMFAVPPEEQPRVLSRLVRVGAFLLGPEGRTEASPDPIPTMSSPQELGPDGVLDMELDHEFVNCSHYVAGGSTSFDTVEVDYRVEGHKRTATVDLGSTYSVVSPADQDCPLDRRSSDGD